MSVSRSVSSNGTPTSNAVMKSQVRNRSRSPTTTASSANTASLATSTPENRRSEPVKTNARCSTMLMKTGVTSAPTHA